MELIMTRLFSDISSAIFDQLVPNSSLARKHLMLIKKNVQGFSLIELMVAVGIMGGMTTLAVPQYGKYKLKAARTEVKATLANIHGAQELHMVDKNYYSPDLTDIGLDKVVPTVVETSTSHVSANDTGQNFVYGAIAVAPSNDANGKFRVGNGTTNSRGTNQTDSVEYRIVASAVRKLASCATLVSSHSDVWCLSDEKLITNGAATGSTFKPSGAKCANIGKDTTGDC